MDILFTVRPGRAPPVSNRLSVNDAEKGETWQMRVPNDHDEVKMGGSMWKSPVSSLLHLASDSVLVVHGGELTGGGGEERGRGREEVGRGKWGMTNTVEKSAFHLSFFFSLMRLDK